MKAKQSIRGRKGDAFTFFEVLAALVFLAILVPAIIQGLLIANKTAEVSERSSVAGELAENKMNEILMPIVAASVSGTNSGTGLGTSSSSTSATSGDFGTDFPGYRWETSQQTWDGDNVNTMTEMSVTVYYPVQGKERNFKLTTLVSGTTESQTAL